MRSIREAACWLVLGAIVYAPWDFGATEERGIATLSWLLGAATLLWLLDYRSLASLPRTLAGLVILLLLAGWWMVVNATSIYDSEQHMFVRLTNLLPRAPGTVDQAVSAAWMFRATGLLGAMCVVAGMCRDPVWLLRLWKTIGVTGGSIAFLGLVQKALGAPMIFWLPVDEPVSTFFATYFYHGNAGAFLNLTLPLTCGLALRAFARPRETAARAIWLVLAVVHLVAVCANTSRMSQFLGAGIALALLGGLLPRFFGAARGVRWSTAAIGTLAVLLALFAVTQASRLDRSLQRWDNIRQTVPADARWIAVQAAARAFPEAGWFGFGPGTFHIIFPYFTAGFGERLHGFWLFLHNDYVQTLLEWGWVGGALWACIFFGGMGLGICNRLGRKAAAWRRSQRLLLSVTLLGLASAALHALVDFPLQIASIQLYAATYLGICWGSLSWKQSPGIRTSSSPAGERNRA